MKTISLTQLLSSCLEAGRLGCEIIQDFHNKGSVTGTLKESGEIKSVVTQADIDAQARIIGSLRLTWGDDLCIIGEEDESEAKLNMDGGPLNKELLGDNILDEALPLDEIALFVDPLDGTREFVEGRLQNVACLIGITRNNRPIAGVISLPFPDGNPHGNVQVHYAVADQEGSAGMWPKESEDSQIIEAQDRSDGEVIKILTGDSTDPVLVNATNCAKTIAKDYEHVLVGGTAAKLRIVATEPNCLAVLHFKTELWDTCAPQALISSKDGKVTDLFGAPLVHKSDRPFGNIFGVVASSGDDKASKVHDELCKRMRADPKSVHKIFGKWMGDEDTVPPTVPQAMDVARDLNGIPFSVEEIQKDLVGESSGAKLRSYSVPESGAWRGMMSNGGRVQLDWKKGNGVTQDDLPSTMFYKRIVMADLDHARAKLKTAPHKLIRDVKSYQVETSFLTSRACQEGVIKEAGLRINRVYGADLRPVSEERSPKEQLESCFSVFLEDFDVEHGWGQQWLLDEEAAKAALETFARMHAYFWVGSNFWKKDAGRIGEELEHSVWQNGGYMQPKLQGYDQLENVARGWTNRYPTFKDALAKIPELEGADLENLGKRLEQVAETVGKLSHPFAHSDDSSTKSFLKYRTMIHGDPKQANIFFRQRTDDSKPEVGLIDFQWSGFGLAATDVAHFICAAIQPSCISFDGKKESSLLDHYYAYLSEALVEFGVAPSVEAVESDAFPRSVLQDQFEIAVLDICRMVYAYAWSRWKAEPKPTPASLNRNSYNKSFDNCLWLITRCHVLLESKKSQFK